MTFPVGRKIKCLDREIGMRMVLYPGFVKRGKMTQATADEEIAILQEIRQEYAVVERQTVLMGKIR